MDPGEFGGVLVRNVPSQDKPRSKRRAAGRGG